MRKFFLFLLTGLMFSAFSEPKIIVENPWIRAVSPFSKNTALFMTIVNKSDKQDILVSVKTDIAKMSMIHKTVEENGVMKMKHIKNLVIPPHSKIELKPGTLHIMIMGLKRPIKEGEKIKVNLMFKHSGNIEISAPVLRK